MKKLFFTLSLIFALSLSANAQDRKAVPQELAKKEVSTLAEMVGLTSQQTEDLYRLFEQKYVTLADPAMSAERKAEMSRIVDMKLEATLTGAQIEKLKANKKEYEALKTSLTAGK
jgi:hypothetical protein